MAKVLKHNTRYFLSCDWGTTSFRLKIVDIQTGNLIAKLEDQDGIKKINNRWLEYDGRLNRTGFFLSHLQEKISHLKKRSTIEIGNFPLIISGMASSGIGIKELPYATLPVSLTDPDLFIDEINASDHLPHTLYLVSGLKTGNDIMRGEEIQIIGLAERHPIKNGVYILPGTHSKHVYINNNMVQDFKTYLTGELFELLVSESILTNSVHKSSGLRNKTVFYKGVVASGELNLLHTLFKIRASDILDESDPVDNYEFLSGLLIGSELSALCTAEPEQIVIAGTKNLQDYYSAACDYMKLNYLEADSSVDITTAGHRKILSKVRNQK